MVKDTTTALPGAAQPTALLRRLRWTVLRPLASALGGNERSLVRGPGVELDEVREYQPGDDVRHIDWNITARTDQPFVRQARVERALDVWLVMDVSPSVDWGTASCLKRDRSLEMAAVAGQVLAQHGNRIGALLFAEKPLGFVPPGAGRTHLLRLLAGIRDTAPQRGRGTTDMTAALARIDSVARRRAMLLIVSDFLVPEGWQPVLRRLAQRHEVVAVQVRDPRERELPDVGMITLEDPETGGQLIVNTSDRKLRERFRQAALAQDETLRRELARSGVDMLALSTAEDLLPAMLRFLHSRRARRGR
ncbi:MAG: DUF58 domain-containing protein [Chloroflexaceae bacterium]|jgi:uncharacterized protein (DUF58 family)|nr:DUF58 domain-containing protein [Chloroflexaceae bacterium]